MTQRVRSARHRSWKAAGPRLGALPVVVAALLTLLFVLATAVLIITAPDAPLGSAWGFRGFAAILAVAYGAVGALVALRVPGNGVGPLLVTTGLWGAGMAFCIEYAAYGLAVAPGSVPFALLIGWLVSWIWVPFPVMTTTFLLLLFPDGHLPSRRWRSVAWLAVMAMVVTSVSLALHPGPVANAPYLENPVVLPEPWVSIDLAGSAIGFVLLALAVVLGALALVQRFRLSSGIARQQLKWFAAASIFAGLMLAGPGTLFSAALAWQPVSDRSTVKLLEILTVLSLLTIPVATGIAILRYRLYEIDRLISRTIGWAVVSGVLACAFVALVLALTTVLEPFTGGGTLAVAGSTLVVAAISSPVRGRVQGTVDRRFDRSRHDGERLRTAFGERLRDEVDLVTISRDVLATVDSAVRPSRSSLWLRERHAS